MNEWLTAPAPPVAQYRTEVEARIAHLEHDLMIRGHEADCPACSGRAWPLLPPKSVAVLR